MDPLKLKQIAALDEAIQIFEALGSWRMAEIFRGMLFDLTHEERIQAQTKDLDAS